jgi:hypothetical protein
VKLLAPGSGGVSVFGCEFVDFVTVGFCIAGFGCAPAGASAIQMPQAATPDRQPMRMMSPGRPERPLNKAAAGRKVPCAANASR